MSLDTTQVFLATASVAAIGWLATHCLARVRERQSLRNDFLSFLVEWQIRIDRGNPRSTYADFKKDLTILSSHSVKFGSYIKDKKSFGITIDKLNALGRDTVTIQSAEILPLLATLIILIQKS